MTNTHQPSDTIINLVIHDLLTSAYQLASQSKLAQIHLSHFSANFIKSCIVQNIDMHISHSQNYNQFEEQHQPENIKGDNMQPGSTMVEEKGDRRCSDEGQVKESASIGKGRRKLSTTSRYSRAVSNRTGQSVEGNGVASINNELVKLNQQRHQVKYQPHQPTDPYVQQLRRLKQLNPKVNPTKRKDKRPFQGQKLRQLQKISYDFTGDIIKVKQLNQLNTLFATHIQSICQNDGRIIKHQQEVSMPTDINSHRGKKDRPLASKNPLLQHNINVQFSNIQSLTPHLQLIENAKFIHGKTIVEKKKANQQTSLAQLRKSMSLNKLSRSQFSKLKDTSNNIRKPLPILKSSIPSLPLLKNQDSQVVASGGRDKQLSVRGSDREEGRQRKKFVDGKKSSKVMEYERVSVENEELTEMLVEDEKGKHWMDVLGLGDGGHLKQEANLNDTHQTQTPQLEQLTPRDIANLHYIKTAGTIGSLHLPKIQSITSNPNPILQSKSKIKSKQQQLEIQRLKKHFEDKLRV